jgi:hypothetical protein
VRHVQRNSRLTRGASDNRRDAVVVESVINMLESSSDRNSIVAAPGQRRRVGRAVMRQSALILPYQTKTLDKVNREEQHTGPVGWRLHGGRLVRR